MLEQKLRIRSMQIYNIKDDYIELVKLLKLLNISESGGQAKKMIEEGLVFRNGKLEYRKRAKIRKGDTIEVFDQIIQVQ